MEYRVLETRSADILTKYYNNEIDSFLNACHEDILWIGPAEKHVIRTRKALVDAFSQEEHKLEFVLSDLKVFSIGLTERSCEVIMFFILDTIWPDSSVGRADQRIQFSWVSENGEEKKSFVTFPMPLNMMNVTGYILYIMKKYTRKMSVQVKGVQRE